MGVSGDTSDDLIKRFPIECQSRRPDIIIIAIGINDSRYIEHEDNPDVSSE